MICYDGVSGTAQVNTPSRVIGKATSDTQGRYTIADVQIEAVDSAFTVYATSAGQCWDHVLCYYDEKTRGPLTDNARYGRELGAEGVWLVLSSASTVRGRVTDDAGRPVAGARIFDGIPRNGPTETNANGEFILDKVPSQFDRYYRYGSIRVEHPDFVHDIFSEAVESRENLELRLRRGVLISGRVTTEDGKPLERIGVYRQQDERTYRLECPNRR